MAGQGVEHHTEAAAQVAEPVGAVVSAVASNVVSTAASSRWLWLCSAAPLAGFALLTLAQVPHLLFFVQGFAWVLALGLLVTGSRTTSAAGAGSLQALAALLVLLLAAPLFSSVVAIPTDATQTSTALAVTPQRWLTLGAFQLYSSALVLPALLVLLGRLIPQPGRAVPVAVLAFSAGVFLLLQTDAAQLLALTVAMLLLLLPGLRAVQVNLMLWLTLLALAGLSYLALQQPDPLAPVPYVEGVFALAWQTDWRVGAALLAAAVLLLVGLYAQSQQDQPWLAAVAGYYAVCFGGSVAGVTPAPLLGYGAAPVLGFGLMLALSLWGRSPPAAQARL